MDSRRIGRGLAIPALGLGTAVIVAWVFALSERSSPSSTPPPSIGALVRGTLGGIGSDEYWLYGARWYPPGEVRDALLGGRSPSNADAILVRTAGWPFRAFRCGRFLLADGTGYDDWGMIRFGGPRSVGVAFDRVLPVSPLWIGIAADAAIFSAAWWATLGGLWRFSGPARRRRRRSLGLCIECGYDPAPQV